MPIKANTRWKLDLLSPRLWHSVQGFDPLLALNRTNIQLCSHFSARSWIFTSIIEAQFLPSLNLPQLCAILLRHHSILSPPIEFHCSAPSHHYCLFETRVNVSFQHIHQISAKKGLKFWWIPWESCIVYDSFPEKVEVDDDGITQYLPYKWILNTIIGSSKIFHLWSDVLPVIGHSSSQEISSCTGGRVFSWSQIWQLLQRQRESRQSQL